METLYLLTFKCASLNQFQLSFLIWSDLKCISKSFFLSLSFHNWSACRKVQITGGATASETSRDLQRCGRKPPGRTASIPSLDDTFKGRWTHQATTLSQLRVAWRLFSLTERLFYSHGHDRLSTPWRSIWLQPVPKKIMVFKETGGFRWRTTRGESKGTKQIQEMCDLDRLNHNNNTLLGRLTTLSGRRCSWGIQGVLGLTWKCLPWALSLGLVLRDTWPERGHTHTQPQMEKLKTAHRQPEWTWSGKCCKHCLVNC